MMQEILSFSNFGQIILNIYVKGFCEKNSSVQGLLYFIKTVM